ncbi:hypothetical protein ACSFA8_15130 [Variovorax sp. RT4R15]|uniref:VMAP-C domain-containing protein n=1 Tax=Variovorax sp. RT4R15 TaxID=3443737 RepID=UPI003F47ED82
MTPVSDPKRAFAVIVAVEKSSILPSDPLLGPVADASRVFDWAVKCGVDPSRIRLFVSAKSGSEHLLANWDANYPQAIRAAATEVAIRDFFAKELPKSVPKDGDGLLLVAWSGHGLIDQRAERRSRLLFYEDSAARVPIHCDVTSLMQLLKERDFAGFRQQVLVVDACATYSGSQFGGQSLGPSTNFGRRNNPDVNILQWAMMAASPGETAYTEAAKPGATEAAGSKCMNRLLDQLTGPAARKPWPNFQAAFSATRQSFFGDEQMPVSFAIGSPDDLTDDDGIVLTRTRTTQLAREVNKLQVDVTTLRACFSAALQVSTLAETHEWALRNGLAEMIELLGETAHLPGQPDALERFALEVAARTKSEPIRAGVVTWLGRSLGPNIIQSELDRRRNELAAPRSSICFLLVDECAPAAGEGASTLQGWLFIGKSPVPIFLVDDDEEPDAQTEATRAEALGSLIGLAISHANSAGIARPFFILEFALPLARIDEDVETQLFDDGMSHVPVGQRYAVVRRIADRMRALQRAQSRQGRKFLPALDAWKRAAEFLKQRFSVHGLRLVWMEPEHLHRGDLALNFENNPTGSCVGLAMAVVDGTLTESARQSLVGGAVPFACWPRAPWTEIDRQTWEADMANCADDAALEKVFTLKRTQGEKHPSAGLSILWDDPSHDPYAQQLGAKGAAP